MHIIEIAEDSGEDCFYTIEDSVGTRHHFGNEWVLETIALDFEETIPIIYYEHY